MNISSRSRCNQCKKKKFSELELFFKLNNLKKNRINFYGLLLYLHMYSRSSFPCLRSKKAKGKLTSSSCREKLKTQRLSTRVQRSPTFKRHEISEKEKNSCCEPIDRSKNSCRVPDSWGERILRKRNSLLCTIKLKVKALHYSTVLRFQRNRCWFQIHVCKARVGVSGLIGCNIFTAF